jgi:thiol-disulfide isomerase/thioredoxin
MIRRISLSAMLLASILSASGELSNRRAPGFAIPDPDYSHYYDLQDYRGKVVLIDFMTTTCPHCMLLSSTLEKVKEKYGDKIAILSVVLPPDNQQTVAKYKEVHHVTVPIACDMGQMAIAYMNAKPGMAHMDVPHLFVIDRQGMIRNDFTYGDQDKAVFEGTGLFPEVDKLLK